jgi:hypothetical protein
MLQIINEILVHLLSDLYQCKLPPNLLKLYETFSLLFYLFFLIDLFALNRLKKEKLKNLPLKINLSKQLTSYLIYNVLSSHLFCHGQMLLSTLILF